MRIIVCPHDMAMGGSQINALELAGCMKERGHNVLLYAPSGVLDGVSDDLGLNRVVAPTALYPSLSWVRGLKRVVKDFRPDLIHTYEWAPSMGAAYGVRPWLSVPQVMTVLSMDIPGFLPTDIPLIVGTQGLAEGVAAARVHVIEPLIDTELNRASDVAGARERIGVRDGELILSIVCRITDDLGKARGIIDAIEAIESVSHTRSLRMFIVGDGPAFDRVRVRAEESNSKNTNDSDRNLVELVGEVPDPSDYYEASDIVLGMGSSILRAMSFAKPVIVQGEHGFGKLLTPGTAPQFLRDGFFGTGGNGAVDLVGPLTDLVSDELMRQELGQWGRSLIEERFSLDSAAGRLDAIYRDALDLPARSGTVAVGLARSLAGFTKFRVSQLVSR